MSDFAKAQLLKYGWTEGKGLGKNENGIAEALKPKLKFDTSGVGHKDNEFHWWDSVYDKALKNIVLETNSDKVSINVAQANAFHISSTKVGIEGSKNKKHKLQYGNFLKTSTLENGNMIKDETCEVLEENNVDNPTEFKMTDEELFNACGGRTAHKGARHGLTLSGKLARIAKQEKQLLTAGYLRSNEKPENKEITVEQKKKKKRKRDMEVEDCTTNVNNNDYYLDDDDCLKLPPLKEDYKPSKKTRMKSARKVNDLVNQLNKSWSIDSESVKIEQIPYAQNGDAAVAEVPCAQNGDATVVEIDDQNLKIKKKGKKKKSKRKHDQEVIVVDDNLAIEHCKKKKKSKRKRDQEVIVFNDNITIEPCKKKKKKEIMEEVPSMKENENEKDTNDMKIMYESINLDVNRINDKIIRKKQRKYEKKEKKKLEQQQLEQLSKSLLAVNLHINATQEVTETTSKPSKKKRKKENKHKKEKNHKKEKGI